MTRSTALPKTRILIVDDHPAVRDALASWIGRHPDLEVCGEADDMSKALSLVAETEPDLAVVDISLKTGNGIDLVRRISDRSNRIRILVWSTHSEAFYAQRALRAGALGYVNKERSLKTLLEAIRRVREGKVYLSEAMTESLLHVAVGEVGKEASRFALNTLADRELEVLCRIGEGAKTAEIAETLQLSVDTVETYLERIETKLDLKSGDQLAHFAAQWVLENG